MLNDDLNPQDNPEGGDPGTGDPADGGGAGDSSILDELGLGNNGQDDTNAIDPTAFKELSDNVARLTAEIETERQARRTAEGRLKAERERSRSSDPYDDDQFDDNNLSDEARIVLKRQLDRERREDERWRRFEETNALVESGVDKQTAERIWDLENSNNPEDYMAGLNLRKEATDKRRQEQRDAIRRQQLGDRAGTPEGGAGGQQTTNRGMGHSAAEVAKAVIDKKRSISETVKAIGTTYGEAEAAAVIKEYEKLQEAGYTPAQTA